MKNNTLKECCYMVSKFLKYNSTYVCVVRYYILVASLLGSYETHDIDGQNVNLYKYKCCLYYNILKRANFVPSLS